MPTLPQDPTRTGRLAVLMALAAAGLACAAAPNGGPWAPQLIDMATVRVRPRAIEPGEAITVTFSCRPGQAGKIKRLELQLRPPAFEADVTSGLDRGSGQFAWQIPKGKLKLEGAYQVRPPVDFLWDDGKVYHRGPPFGSVTVTAFARTRYTSDTFQAELQQAERDVRAASDALAKAQRLPRMQSVIDDMHGTLRAAREAFAGGKHSLARRRLVRARWGAIGVSRRPLAAEYLFDLRRYLRTHPNASRPLLTLMSGSSSEVTPSDVELIRGLGCHAVVHHSPQALRAFAEAGFDTIAARPPARFTEPYVKEHPQHRQERYLLSDPVKASSTTQAIALLTGFVPGHFEVATHGAPQRYWKVYDRTAGRTLASKEWTFDHKAGRVVLRAGQVGHEYQVAFLAYCRDAPFFHTFGDPIYPGCRASAMRRLDSYFKQRPGLAIYRPTSLFYPFPKIDKVQPTAKGPRRIAWHNWYGYQWGACPQAQELFRKSTGIAFDPDWITDHGRYGDVNYPPRREYLAWMRFQQENVTAWTKDVVDLAHRAGAKTRVFWGDHWMGMEPYSDFFARTGMDQIVKACGSSVVVRMTVDVPGPVRKVIRFHPWLDWQTLFRHPRPVGRMETGWGDMKRAILFRTPDGLTWGGQTQTVALRQEGIGRKMREFTDEFRVIYALLAGREAFRHDLTLYVLNAWGPRRSWPEWCGVNPSQRILTHLTDLPIRVKFLALWQVAETGVPADADVLLNAGEPGSAWSGGHYWKDERVARAVEAFVAKGGGLIGVGAVSCTGDKPYAFALERVLGLNAAGPTDAGAARGSFNRYDAAFLDRGPVAAWTATMTACAADHWITDGANLASEPIRVNLKVKAAAPDVRLLASGDGRTFAPPVLAVREHHRGRVVYLNGYSTAPGYGRLLRRSVFWTAGSPDLADRLSSETPNVFVYLYPETRLLVAYNMNREAADAIVRVDTALLRDPRDGPVALYDVLGERSLPDQTAAALRQGMRLALAAHAAKFVRIGRPQKR